MGPAGPTMPFDACRFPRVSRDGRPALTEASARESALLEAAGFSPAWTEDLELDFARTTAWR